MNFEWTVPRVWQLLQAGIGADVLMYYGCPFHVIRVARNGV